uniref:Uncharacterized protein n=1 Tax=Romanomermis culicivorax TaxID=13658 RepID=A0A915L7Y9_ROMCU
MDVDAWASVFWEEASFEFKSWWKSQQREEYLARMKCFWGFMKCPCGMFKNPSLDDEQLASHLWNILPPGGRAQWTNANQQYIDQCIGLDQQEKQIWMVDSERCPARVQMDEQKREYKMEVYNRGNISLDPWKISKNPGKRALAKLMLNSFWGK